MLDPTATREFESKDDIDAEGHNLSLSFGPVAALTDASISLSEGESVAIVGPSGSGKSSLLHCLSGILRPTSGSVRFQGVAVDTASDAELIDLRRSAFGFVFQFGELVPELTLVENVALPLRFAGVPRREAETASAAVLSELGLRELLSRRPSQVSGGEMQRAALARGLVHSPKVVFADEPTGALETQAGDVVLELLIDRSRARGASVVLVTHDDRVAARADRVVPMRDGRTLVPVKVTEPTPG